MAIWLRPLAVLDPMPAKISLKPKFWDHHDVAAGPFKQLFNFRRLWKQSVLLTASVTLLPLIFMAVIDYSVSKRASTSEMELRTARLVSNTRRTVSYFLSERKAALEFIVFDNAFHSMIDPYRLEALLLRSKKVFGGFTDLGVIDSTGMQRAYVGPYDLKGVSYEKEAWYREVLERGIYVSDVFLGMRHVPHFVIAVRNASDEAPFYVVRASIDTERFHQVLAEIEVSGRGDVFIINRKGILQTPSRFYGEALTRIPIPVPAYSERSEVHTVVGPDGKAMLVGYAYIENTPFILMICKYQADLMASWTTVQLELLGFLTLSVIGILVVVLGGSTYLVGRIYEADQRRVAMLHQVEYANKMASIGRLAAGVAHEINNPLAIINEKAGLIKDLFTLKQSYDKDEKLLGIVDVIISSVERCATITRRLLGFARHMGSASTVESLHIEEVINEIFGFLSKETSYRAIHTKIEVPDDIPKIATDRGKLQQILLNLLNNALAAVADGGHLDISAKKFGTDHIALKVSDDGCGIPQSDLNRVFEPFFSTKTKQGGTGLGLSITYGLTQELGGTIRVKSELGKGTTFTVVLPIKPRPHQGERDIHADTLSG
jgi:two-component system NtrC family sensor kinase